MPRALAGPPPPPPPLLLLMAGLALAATPPPPPPPPLEVINPWLSACDLQPASAADLQGACSAGLWGPGPLCPPPCGASADASTQCLHYLEESHKDEVCGRGSSPERRRRALQGLRLRHCCEHAANLSLPDGAHRDEVTCRHLLDALLEVDALAARMSCEFAEVLTRYDCAQPYSIVHSCRDCKEAYRKWVCSSLVPHFLPGHADVRVRPCRSVCQSVEEQCPYMLPGDRAPAHPTQYAGEPTFLCLDPNIPETGEQLVKSSHGDEDCCYTHCGTPGRGLCVNCPRKRRRKEEDEGEGDGGGGGKGGTRGPTPVRCAVGLATKTSECRVLSGGAAKTTRTFAPLVFVHLLWTAWISLETTTQFWTFNSDSLKCLLVMCADCARTLSKWIKTKWRACS